MLALYMIDLDGFKPINDVHGHDAGDEALVMVAQRLKQANAAMYRGKQAGKRQVRRAGQG